MSSSQNTTKAMTKGAKLPSPVRHLTGSYMDEKLQRTIVGQRWRYPDVLQKIPSTSYYTILCSNEILRRLISSSTKFRACTTIVVFRANTVVELLHRSPHLVWMIYDTGPTRKKEFGKTPLL
jgi:hypothetical protein